MYNMNSKHQKNSKFNSIFGLVNHDVKLIVTNFIFSDVLKISIIRLKFGFRYQMFLFFRKAMETTLTG